MTHRPLTAARGPTLSRVVGRYIGGRAFQLIRKFPKALILVLLPGDSVATCAPVKGRCGGAFETRRSPRGPLGATCNPLAGSKGRSRHTVWQGTHPECIQVRIVTPRNVAVVVFAPTPVTTPPPPLLAPVRGPTWSCICYLAVLPVVSSRHRHRDAGAHDAPLLRPPREVIRRCCWAGACLTRHLGAVLIRVGRRCVGAGRRRRGADAHPRPAARVEILILFGRRRVGAGRRRRLADAHPRPAARVENRVAIDGGSGVRDGADGGGRAVGRAASGEGARARVFGCFGGRDAGGGGAGFPGWCWRRGGKSKPCNVGPKSYLRNVAQRGANVSHY